MTFDPKILAQVARCFCFLPAREVSAFKIYLLCQWANRPTGPTCDPDAQAFLDYAQITDPVISAAICQLVADLKANPAAPATSFWDRETIIYPMVSGPAANNLSWRANLKTPGTYDLLEIPGALPTYSVYGIQGNVAVSSHLNTQYSPSVAAGDFKLRIFYYLDIDIVSGGNTYYWASWGNTCAWSGRKSAGTAANFYFKDATSDAPYAAASVLGAWVIQRHLTTHKQAARGAAGFTTIARAQVSGGTTFPIHLFCLNNVGAFSQFGSPRFSGWSLGQIFDNDAEWLLYRGIWETFQANLNTVPTRAHPLGV